MKISKRNITKLLILLAAAIIIAVSYYFGYKPYTEQRHQVESEIADLEIKERELLAKIESLDNLREQAGQFEEKLKTLISAYGESSSLEQGLITIDTIIKSTGLVINGYTITESIMVGSVEDYISEYGTGLFLYKTSFTLSYQSTYDDLKRFVEYVNAYPERANITDISMNYDMSSGNLSGDMKVDVYSFKSGEAPEVYPDIQGIAIGRDNVFGTVEIPIDQKPNVVDEGTSGKKGKKKNKQATIDVGTTK